MKCPVPPSLKKRPRYRGLAVPFMTGFTPDGRPLFGFDNMRLKLRVAEHRLCGQCGEPLGKVFAFLGDAERCEGRMFKEPGMHLPCVDYAMRVCPYLAHGQHMQTRPPDHDHMMLIRYGDEKLPPVERWGVYLTRSYQIVTPPTGQLLFVAGEQVGATIWYASGERVGTRPVGEAKR